MLKSCLGPSSHVTHHKNFDLLKTEVLTSQRTSAKFHKPLVPCSTVGTVYKADCSCMAVKACLVAIWVICYEKLNMHLEEG